MKTLGGCSRAANDAIIGLPPLPASIETGLAVGETLWTTPPNAEEVRELKEAVERAYRLPPADRAGITPKLVAEKLLTLRSAAKPGRTQMRNSHLKALLNHQSGCEALAELTELFQHDLLSE